MRGDRLAVDVDLAVAQQRHQRGEVLLHVARGPVVRQPVGLLDGHLVRQPDPEHEACIGGRVHRERLRRQRDRVARVRGDHRGAELARAVVSRPTSASTVSASNPELWGSHTAENPRPADLDHAGDRLVERCVLLGGEEDADAHAEARLTQATTGHKIAVR